MILFRVAAVTVSCVFRSLRGMVRGNGCRTDGIYLGDTVAASIGMLTLLLVQVTPVVSIALEPSE